jgi:hypothetical protein
MSELVVSQRRKKQAATGQPCQLHSGHRSAPARFGPGIERVHDGAGLRHSLDASKLDPFDVSDDCNPHPEPVSQSCRQDFEQAQ